MPRVIIHYNANVPARSASDLDRLMEPNPWAVWKSVLSSEGTDPMVKIADFFIPEHTRNGFGPIHFDSDEKLLRYLEVSFSYSGGYQESIGVRGMNVGDTITIDGRIYIWTSLDGMGQFEWTEK